MKKYFWLLCLGGMLGGCYSSPHSQEESAAVVAASETVGYSPVFQKFARQFKTVSLPYTLDTAHLVDNYDEEPLVRTGKLKSIDKRFLRAYLSSAKIEALEPLLEDYLMGKNTAGVSAVPGSGESRTYFYYISMPVKTDAFTALVIGCYDSGREMCPNLIRAYAFLCTFTPRGQFISSVVLAEDQEEVDPPLYASTISKGTINADLAIEVATTQTIGEYLENEEKPKETVTRTVQKYRVAADGTIKQVAGEQ